MNETASMEAITIPPSEPLDLTAQLEHIKQTYPAYYRAWKSIISTYTVSSLCTEWRGTIGLMRFIEDTSTLPNAPSLDAGTDNKNSKIKRRTPHLAFSTMNVYWKLTTKGRRNPEESNPTGAFIIRTNRPNTIEDINTKYPTMESKEDRVNTLFNESMNRALSQEESIELDILSQLIVGNEIAVVEKLSKYEDI